MIELEKELHKYKPLMDVNAIEEYIGEEDIKDVIDIIRELLKASEEQEGIYE